MAATDAVPASQRGGQVSVSKCLNGCLDVMLGADTDDESLVLTPGKGVKID